MAPSTRSPNSSTGFRARGGLHVDGCLGGFLLPFGAEMGYDIPVFDFRARRHQHLRRQPQAWLRVEGRVHLAVPGQGLTATRSTSTYWTGPAASTCHRASRIPVRRSDRRRLGVDGAMGRRLPRLREGHLRNRLRHAGRVRSHPELTIMATPRSASASRSDEFDIYHVADALKPKGWRFNGQQYPNAPSTWRSPVRRPSPAWWPPSPRT